MRRLSMKSKRRKSETTSDSGSEENGVARPNAADANEDGGKDEKENEGHEAAERAGNPRKSTAKKRPSRSRATAKAQSDEYAGDKGSEEEPEEEENGNIGKGGGAGKRRKKEDQKASTSIRKGTDDEEYEVEKIVGQRTIKGRRQFLVRWKGYGEDSDTWEQEKDLNCVKLIEQYLEEEGEHEEDDEQNMVEKTVKNMTKAKSPKAEKKSKKSRGNIYKKTKSKT